MTPEMAAQGRAIYQAVCHPQTRNDEEGLINRVPAGEGVWRREIRGSLSMNYRISRAGRVPHGLNVSLRRDLEGA